MATHRTTVAIHKPSPNGGHPRLSDWAALTSIWKRLRPSLLLLLSQSDQLEWERTSIDRASIPFPLGRDHIGGNSTDRSTSDGKPHVIVDCRGVPLVVRKRHLPAHSLRTTCGYSAGITFHCLRTHPSALRGQQLQ